MGMTYINKHFLKYNFSGIIYFCYTPDCDNFLIMSEICLDPLSLHMQVFYRYR